MSYIRNTDLSLNTDQVIVFPTWQLRGRGMQEFGNQLKQLSGVTASTMANTSLFASLNSTTDLEWTGKTKDSEFWISQMNVDRNFMEFFDIQLKEGKNFDQVSANNPMYILNETAIKKMGLKDPVGQTIKFHEKPGTIIGVVKDFHFQSMHNEMMPAILNYDLKNAIYVYLRVQPQQAQNVIAAAEKAWKKFEPVLPLEYAFLNDQIAKQYDRETKAAYLFDAFAVVTMLISCLGLFGLTTYSAERRIKEIGIRKVLGAGVGRIAVLLSKEFVRLVIIATFIAIPIVWFSMNRLLEDFAYRTELSWWVFALAALGAIGLALITMSFQAIKAGLSNPVKSLRTE
jgi:putative ABC transport system permease protein